MFSKLALLALVSAAFAADHQVAVGAGGSLTFQPNKINAAAGDTVTFTYMQNNHSVTAGDFNNACQPGSPLQFNSGFVPANQGTNGQQPSYTINVANTQPMAVYCAQAQHCQKGMVMVINGNNNGAQSVQAFKKAAKQANTNTPATQIMGGTLNNFAGNQNNGQATTGNGNNANNGGNNNNGGNGGNNNNGGNNGGNGNNKKNNKMTRRGRYDARGETDFEVEAEAEE